MPRSTGRRGTNGSTLSTSGAAASSYRPGDAPAEIVRRIVSRAIRKLATEGEADLRGAELDRLLTTLADGGTATIRGVLCTGGREWRFTGLRAGPDEQ